MLSVQDRTFPMFGPSSFELFLLNMTQEELIGFLNYFPPHYIFVISRLSWLLRGICQFYCAKAWDIDKHFRKWFYDPRAFRSALGTCGGVVSGSQALQFFERTSYQLSDLDIYIRPEGSNALVTWLIKEGYTLEHTSDDYTLVEPPRDESATDTLSAPLSAQMEVIHNLVRNFGEPGQVNRIQVVVVSIDPTQYILNNFHSSMFLKKITFLLPGLCLYSIQRLSSILLRKAKQ